MILFQLKTHVYRAQFSATHYKAHLNKAASMAWDRVLPDDVVNYDQLNGAVILVSVSGIWKTASILSGKMLLAYQVNIAEAVH